MHFNQQADGALEELWSLLLDDTALTGEFEIAGPLLQRSLTLAQKLVSAASASQLYGLQAASAMLEANLQISQRRGQVLTLDEAGLFSTCSELLLAYVMTEGDHEASQALFEHLSRPGWPLPMGEAESGILRFMLLESVARPSGPAAVPAQALASVEEISHSAEPQAAVAAVMAEAAILQDNMSATPDDAPLKDEATPLAVEAMPGLDILPDDFSPAHAEAEAAAAFELPVAPASADVTTLVAAPQPETFTPEQAFAHFNQHADGAVEVLWSLLLDEAGLTGELAAVSAVLQQSQALAQSIATAAATSQLYGLQAASVRLEANLQAMQQSARALSPSEAGLLATCSELLLAYVMSEGDDQASQALYQHLTLSDWPVTLGATENQVLRDALRVSAEETRPEALARNDSEPPPAFVAATAASPTTQQVDADMQGMMIKEFTLIGGQLAEDLIRVVAPQLPAEARRAALDDYMELLVRIGRACEAIGLSALSAVFARLVTTLEGLAQQGDALDVNAEQHALLEQLPGRVVAYLTWPTDHSAAAALLDLLTDASWPTPLMAEVAANWVNDLIQVEIVTTTKQKPVRQTVANAADVSLALPEDINPELLDGLLQEMPEHTSAFTSAIQHLATGQGSPKDVERAMRAAHTLKGAANTVGVRGIAVLTHTLEDILSALAEAGALPDRPLATILVSAGDCLEAMNEALTGVGPAPEQARQVLQEVLDYANRVDRDGVAEVLTPDMPLPQQADEAPHEEAAGQDKAAAPVVNALRVPAPVVDEMLRLAGETLIANSQLQERFRLLGQQSDSIRSQLALFQQLVAELENLVDVRGIAAFGETAHRAGDFDPLEMERYGELHTVTRRLIEASNDAQQMQVQEAEQIVTLREALEGQQRLHMDSQRAVLRTRLVSVATVVSRLQRGVRQTCRLLDKQVSLNIVGDNTSIDSNVLNELMDPLMHLLRNAVDHGIEAPSVRAAAGKVENGKIELHFAREGNTIVVRCQDDGAGLDYAAIRHLAESRGMLEKGREPSHDELARMILVNGFSTREDATQVSGRGVGMDVVYSRVLAMKGSLVLHSKPGAGLTVEVRLPATLLSAHTLIVRNRNKLLAISSHGVEDIQYVTRDMMDQVGNQHIYHFGDAVHGLLRLDNLLGLPTDRRADERHGFPVLLTRTDSGATVGVLVHEIVNSREVVLKKIGQYVPPIQGTVGAVILGDGSVAPVLDLVELLRSPDEHKRRKPTTSATQAAHPSQDEPGGLVALVVDDSLSARRATSKVLQDAGYQVRTAIDGLEAVNMLTKLTPQVMLVDMEMPRMNGLELTTHVRGTEHLRKVPIIMITSRSTDKHRHLAQEAGVDVYLTKPFSDDELIAQVDRLVHK